jgi:N-acetylgalactosamine-N,N'-diacetylbacillosaminyl-diphospho-undecaprenol 4-alpha-N-acetylgalactosaminyltransferase
MFVINSLAGGGAERVMNTLLSYSEPERREFDISLVLLDQEPSAYPPPPWLTVRQLDCRGSLRASCRALRRLFAEVRPDVSLSFLTRANVANIWASRGRPCVISERVNTSSHFGAGLKGRLARLLVRLAYPRASRVVAVSPGVAADLRERFGVPDDKLTTIENPVDIEAVRGRAQEPPEPAVAGPYVVGMGRLVPNKNFSLLIEAFHRSAYPGKLVILGDGPERDRLAQLAAGLGLGERVLLPGFVANPFPVVAGADLFVLPSKAEGFPNGLIEAMALGVAVISTNCASGPSEILAGRARADVRGLLQAEYGVLTPPGEVEPMAEALRSLQDPDVRRRYGQLAAVRAADFRVGITKARYWDILRAEAARS